MARNYNQTLDDYSKMWCTDFMLFNIVKYNFWLIASNSFILRSLRYFEKLKFRNPIEWAVFWVIYPMFVYLLNMLTWLKFKLVESNISRLTADDTRCWGIWIKIYNKEFSDAQARWIITKEDIDNILAYIWKSYKHNAWFDWSDFWYFLNTNWGWPARMSLEVLKYAARKWVLWYTIRTIDPDSDETRAVVEITKRMARDEIYWRKFKALIAEEPYLKKAEELFNFWKKTA